MVLHRSTGEIEHKKVSDLIDYFDDGDDSVVLTQRVFSHHMQTKEKISARIEVFLLRQSTKNRLLDVCDPQRKIVNCEQTFFGENESLLQKLLDKQ